MTTALTTISKEELRQKIENRDTVQVVNVLSPEHYSLGMIKGSLKIPLAELDQRLNELDIHKEVVTYCAGVECPASRNAAEKLAARGYNVRAYEGGIKEWKQAAYPLESRDSSAPNPSSTIDQPSGLSGLPTTGQGT